MLEWPQQDTLHLDAFADAAVGDGSMPPGDWLDLGAKGWADDFGPQFGSEAGGGDDVTDLGEIVVTADPPDRWWDIDNLPGSGGSSGGPGTGGGSGGGQSSGPNVAGLDGHEGLDCASNAIKSDINNKATNDSNEHVAIVFKGADGKLYNSPGFTGASGSVDYQQLGQWMQSRNVAISDIVGLYHNHPASTSTNPDGDYHRYPSNANTVGAGQPFDWAAAAGFVMGGANPATFVLILEDQDGDTRQFAYADKAKYEALTKAEMEAEKDLPPPTDGC